MCNNIVGLVSDYEVETPSRSSQDSCHPSHSSDRVCLEVITISDNTGSEGMAETSLKEETSSSRSLNRREPSDAEVLEHLNI